MKLIKPFRGLRPTRELAARVASHPYDVLNRDEAYELAKDNPHSFLHINKPEVDVDPSMSVYDPRVYQKGAENLQRFIAEGILNRDEADQFYVYQQQMGAHVQVGLVAVASVAAYESGLIKKHEFTRPEKEDDRVHHMDALGAQVGPVFLTYKAEDSINALIAGIISKTPEYDFSADDGTRHTFWLIPDAATTAQLEKQFNGLPCLYVADGHHRSAAASRVQKLREARNEVHNGDESYNWFLVVLFPHDQMQILDYNRIIQDLGDYSATQFIDALRENFDVEEADDHRAAKPTAARQFALYLDKKWYRLAVNDALAAKIDDQDPVQSLDVSIMQQAILTPLLGIEDQRTDKRIDFVGGIRGLGELEKRVDSGEWQAAIALYPTSIESLMDIADANEVMPPKSTWFEPKLKSGLVTHVLD
jgi:uncharacterized protein (DUF1015 family)